MSYASDIILGEDYADTQTEFTGKATAIYFYQYGCERVNLESYDKKTKNLVSLAFDAPRLKSIRTGLVATVTRTGGPGNGHEARATVTR